MDFKTNILVVDDEESIRLSFTRILGDEGHTVFTASSIKEALYHMEQNEFGLLFVDIRLGEDNGLELLRILKEQDPDCMVTLMTGYPNLETVTEALRLGAFDYLAKPTTPIDLTRTVNLALKQRYLEEEVKQVQSNLKAIFRSVSDTIYTVNFQYELLETNESGNRNLCGMKRSFRGQDIRKLEHPCSKKCFSVLEKTLETGTTHEDNYISCSQDPAVEKVVSVTASPLLDGKNTSQGAVMVVRDQSRLVALERDLKDRQSFHRLVGSSEAMQNIYHLIEDLKDVPVNVLIIGESGTGKELVTEALHYLGNRSEQPLVKINCTALPETLLESELFGHVKGSFTGAIKDQAGRFERANGGTIFLDEIGDITPSLQAKLLRVIQEKEFEPIGGHKTIKTDVRVIAATNVNLEQKVAQGLFREDLYYRLKVVQLTLPPLRDRRSDIPALVSHFLEKLGKTYHRQIEQVDPQVLELLMNHAWPGNVRQLQHVIEHAIVLCHDPQIHLKHLPPDFIAGKNQIIEPEASIPARSPVSEKQLIIDTVQACGGNKAKAARQLKMDRSTLYRKISRYDIRFSDD